MSEEPTGGTATTITSSPVVTVVTLNMEKTGSESAIGATDTFTYYINYSNNSQNTASGVTIWDTIPSGLGIISSSLAPVATSVVSAGTFAYWYLTSVAGNNTGGSITITTLASSELPAIALSLTNTAFATSSDMQALGVTLQSNTYIEDVKYVALTARLDSYPNPTPIIPGQSLTVDLVVQNTGYETSATNVSPSAITGSNMGDLYYNSGPTPTAYPSLAPGGTDIFTWIYTAAYAGTVIFSCSAMANEVDTNATLIRTANSGAFTFIIVNPTPTSTITPTWTPTSTTTFTATPSSTFTNTGTFTVTTTPTYTSTSTSTFTESSTPTYTNTINPANQVSATATSTLMPITISPVVTNTPTPNLNMTLSKNYVNPDKGEKLLINVKTQANAQVKIKVYNLTGEVVRSGLDLTAPANGWNQIEWDVRNGDGKIVGEGLYFVYIEAGTDKKLLKVYVIK
jgi:uncharacterized repeat protein (TIGR01451 family)